MAHYQNTVHIDYRLDCGERISCGCELRPVLNFRSHEADVSTILGDCSLRIRRKTDMR